MKRKPTVIDCFCGAGGLSLGFKMAGFDVVYAFDSDEASVHTYNKNLGNHAFVYDIKKINSNTIKEKLKNLDIDVLAGGPPCQGFSVQRRGSDHDQRNYLVNEFLRLVLEIKPSFFLMENVGGLLSVRGRVFLEKMYKECAKANYFLYLDKLNALDYGVPQDRKRVFIIGEKKISPFAKFQFPMKIGGIKTVREAIGDLQNKRTDQVVNHIGDKLTELNLKRFKALKEGQSRDSLPTHLQLNCHKNNKMHRHLDVYGRMWWDRPSPTITARFDSFSRGKFGHPELNRTITLREGARLQSFPDTFVFYGTKGQIARQIGNAVPPLLAKSIATEILHSLSAPSAVSSSQENLELTIS